VVICDELHARVVYESKWHEFWTKAGTIWAKVDKQKEELQISTSGGTMGQTTDLPRYVPPLSRVTAGKVWITGAPPPPLRARVSRWLRGGEKNRGFVVETPNAVL